MNRTAFWLGAISAMGLIANSYPAAQAALLVNGDFETGDLSGWTVFNTPNGTVGQPLFPTLVPEATIFATGGEQSLAFHAGQNTFASGQPAGGGIAQFVDLAAGSFELTADIAVWNQSFNLAGGLFSLLFDGQVIAEHNLSPVSANRLKQTTLHGQVLDVLPGLHEVRLQVQRPYVQAANTPQQYVDNIALRPLAAAPPGSETDTTSVPEPSLMLALLGGSAIAVGLRRSS
ncbi:MAG: hypothetical protein F6J87_05395 [Spirulina sp. SIO3F2]|nr:hypothetical protein [Spirulina sp. SIO3F2]